MSNIFPMRRRGSFSEKIFRCLNVPTSISSGLIISGGGPIANTSRISQLAFVLTRKGYRPPGTGKATLLGSVAKTIAVTI